MTGRSAPVTELLRSAELARAYTLAVIAALVGGVFIEHLAGHVTLVTIQLCLFVLGVVILTARRDEVSFVGLVPSTLIALCGWAFVSVFWTTDAGATLTSWCAMVGVATMAVVIGHVRDTLQTVRALGDVFRWALGLSLGLEVLSGILLDTPFTFLGIQGNIAHLGPIQGIFGTRNLLGFMTVIALVTFVVERRTRSVPRGVSTASIALAAVLAALSASPTVLILVCVVGAATGALALVRSVVDNPRRRTVLQWSLALGVTVVAIVLYTQRTGIISATGAADDLRMRTRLWAMADYYIRLRPVQGWGWFGPWEKGEQPFVTINLILHESHGSALNAYIDVLLQLGWAGLLLFVLLGGVALVRSWLDASQRRSPVYAWTPLILIALATTSLTESTVLAESGWFLLCLTAVRAGQSRSWRRRLDTTGAPQTGPFSPAG